MSVYELAAFLDGDLNLASCYAYALRFQGVEGLLFNHDGLRYQLSKTDDDLCLSEAM